MKYTRFWFCSMLRPNILFKLMISPLFCKERKGEGGNLVDSGTSTVYFQKGRTAMKATNNSEVYHERQKLQFCLVHSLNSLFQQKDAFTRAKLNEISERLSLEESNTETWTPFSVLFKPHHNVFTGNYDINVLIAALEEKGKSVVWHDHRKGASCIDIDAPVLMGIVINVSVTRFGGIWRSRHWIALRKIDGVWFNLDSDLPAPQSFLDAHNVREFLDFTLAQGGEILIVLNEKQS
ncbi:hypothetical protein VNO80_05447 [Phaseolus coccineus]|uniref:ubiquitinyl hydrolase 1 n=1 Tax=Phaseolus coccineus TaxID=3886 RepID=A0AAN9RN05_PHACN